jgi:hypothetical protein
VARAVAHLALGGALGGLASASIGSSISELSSFPPPARQTST